MQQKVLSAVIGLTYIEFLMEHHLSKSTTSSLASDQSTITAASISTFRPTYESTVESLKDGIINSIVADEFYGVPADVIRSLIREHLPEYIL